MPDSPIHAHGPATAYSPHKNQQSIAASFEKALVETRHDVVDAL